MRYNTRKRATLVIGLMHKRNGQPSFTTDALSDVGGHPCKQQTVQIETLWSATLS